MIQDTQEEIGLKATEAFETLFRNNDSSEKFIPNIIQLLRNPNKFIQRKAITILKYYENNSAFTKQLLLQILLEESNIVIQRRAIKELCDDKEFVEEDMDFLFEMR